MGHQIFIGNYQSVGADQGFDETFKTIGRAGQDEKSGKIKPDYRSFHHKNRFFIYGDTRADSGLFVDLNDHLFVFGNNNGNVHIFCTAIGGEKTFFAPFGFYPGYGGKTIITALPKDNDSLKTQGKVFQQ